MSQIKELAVVTIPETIAAQAEVEAQGTVVWFLDEADIATVECQCIHNNPDGLVTKLLDIPVADMRLFSG